MSGAEDTRRARMGLVAGAQTADGARTLRLVSDSAAPGEVDVLVDLIRREPQAWASLLGTVSLLKQIRDAKTALSRIPPEALARALAARHDRLGPA